MNNKHTVLEFELSIPGIIDEIKDNGSLNSINLDEASTKELATKVFNDSGYIKELQELYTSDESDKFTKYYDLLWNVIDQCV